MFFTKYIYHVIAIGNAKGAGPVGDIIEHQIEEINRLPRVADGHRRVGGRKEPGNA